MIILICILTSEFLNCTIITIQQYIYFKILLIVHKVNNYYLIKTEKNPVEHIGSSMNKRCYNFPVTTNENKKDFTISNACYHTSNTKWSPQKWQTKGVG